MEKLKVEKKKGVSKNTIIAIVAVVLVIIVIAVAGMLLLQKGDNKKELEKKLTEMGRDFYENFYYDQIGGSADERTTLLSRFTTVGIKIDLDNLGRYNNGEYKDKISEFTNKKTKEKCSKTNTKVIVYPKSPYGKTDYKIETELDCGFEKEKK